jgi:hypothetical protein
MFRRDTHYRGQRTADLLKLKPFQDAEFTVHDVVADRMALHVDGRQQVKKAASSLVIIHQGVRLQVGSGLSTEQRLRFATDEGRKWIIGRQVTVKYFTKTPDGSLRFPVLKKVWEDRKGRNV